MMMLVQYIEIQVTMCLQTVPTYLATDHPSIHSLTNPHQVIHLLILPLTHLSIHSSAYANWSIHWSINPSIHPYQAIDLWILQLTHASIHPSIHSFIQPNQLIQTVIHPSSRLSIHNPTIPKHSCKQLVDTYYYLGKQSLQHYAWLLCQRKEPIQDTFVL